MVVIKLTKSEAMLLECILDWRIQDIKKLDIGTGYNYEDTERIQKKVEQAIEKALQP